MTTQTNNTNEQVLNELKILTSEVKNTKRWIMTLVALLILGFTLLWTLRGDVNILQAEVQVQQDIAEIKAQLQNK